MTTRQKFTDLFFSDVSPGEKRPPIITHISLTKVLRSAKKLCISLHFFPLETLCLHAKVLCSPKKHKIGDENNMMWEEKRHLSAFV